MKSAVRITVAVMGSLMGAAGVEHGIGEALSGNIAPAGMMIRSWPNSAFFHSLNGEPAMTIVPNLLLTGVLAILLSASFITWSIFFARRKNGGLVMMLLAVPMALFGCGIFPPVQAFLVGVAAQILAIPARKPATGVEKWIGKAWPWLFVICCLAWLALFPGVAVMGYFFGFENVGVLLALIAAAILLLPLSFWSSWQYDRLAGEAWGGGLKAD